MNLLRAAFASILALAPPDGSGDGEFPALVWRLDHSGAPIAEPLVEAFGGVNVEGEGAATWARSRGLDFYVGHAPGRNDLHLERDYPWYASLWERYWEDRDPAPLVRRPCLSEERTFERLRERLCATLAARGGEHGLGISLGDEVGLTPHGAPFDLCTSPACRAAWAAFLAESPKWRFLLPEEGEPPFPDTETTRRAWTGGDPRHVAAWLARREFHYEVVIDLLARLAAASRERSPSTPVGLFGLNGRVAFGDVGAEAVLPFLDFVECYPTLDARELLYTLRAPGVRAFATVFRREGVPRAATRQIWEHWLRGGDGVVLWCDRDLEGDEAYFAATREAVREVRELRASLREWTPAPRGVALLHHADSLALSWLRDALHDGATWPKRFPSYHAEHGTRELLLRGWLRWLEDAGSLPGSLPLERVDGRTPERFPFLVAGELLVVEEEELAALRSYVESGGTLLLSGTFARYDRRGAPSTLDARKVLEALAPERVVEAPLDAARYLVERERAGSGFAAERLEWLRERLGADVLPAWRPRAVEDDPRWLCAEVPLEGGALLCAALPNLQGQSARARPRDLRVAIEGIDPARVRWIHPAVEGDAREPVPLRAGEALVFRLARD